MKRKVTFITLIGLAFVLALGVFLYFIGIPAWIGDQMVGRMESPQRVQGDGDYRGATHCATCHEQQFAEWNESLHSKATTEASFEHRLEQLSWGMKEEQCLTCHAPTPMREEAISCEVCHGPDETKEVVKDVCFRCHGTLREADTQAMLSTPAEFLQSAAHREGKTCVTCHMRSIDGSVSHRFEGSRTAPEVYSGSVTIESVKQRNEQLLIVVRNRVLGHYLPTGAPENLLFLEVTGYNDRGEVVYRNEMRFEKKAWWFRTMPMMVRSDNRLKDGERREIALSIDSELSFVEATLSIRPISWSGELTRVVVDEKLVSL